MKSSGNETLDSALRSLAKEPSYSAYVAISNALHGLVSETTGLQPLKITISRNFTIDAIAVIVHMSISVVSAGIRLVVRCLRSAGAGNFSLPMTRDDLWELYSSQPVEYRQSFKGSVLFSVDGTSAGKVTVTGHF